MNAYCRRAVAQAVELAQEHDGTVCVVTLGPPPAEDTLREAIAWGLARGVETTGVLLTDPAFAGSDTLATARALAALIEREGPFDLILAGRNSVDADTGQVGPELAALLDLPFATGVRHLSLEDRTLHVRCEHDDGWVQAQLDLPAVLSTAERLIDPCKVDPEGRAEVPAELLHDPHRRGPRRRALGSGGEPDPGRKRAGDRVRAAPPPRPRGATCRAGAAGDGDRHRAWGARPGARPRDRHRAGSGPESRRHPHRRRDRRTGSRGCHSRAAGCGLRVWALASSRSSPSRPTRISSVPGAPTTSCTCAVRPSRKTSRPAASPGCALSRRGRCSRPAPCGDAKSRAGPPR